MTSFVIAVMDRNGWTERTDVIIVVNTTNKTIEWIPRDMYVDLIENRLNTAYKMGGSDYLIKCLEEINIHVDYCLCLLPSFIEKVFKIIDSIKVPVKNNLLFKYPLHRHQPIEDGERLVEFKAPYEILSGDRFHEWIGARFEINPIKSSYPDFNRSRRQQLLLNEILKKKDIFDFTSLIHSKDANGMNDEIIEILRNIDESWTLVEIKESQYMPAIINGMSVLTYKI